jgi:hypothetical protein
MGHCFVYLHRRHTWLRYTQSSYHAQLDVESKISDAAVNVTLAFCMGQDLEGLMNSSLGQPMAQIFLNSLGQKGTLVMWSFIILVQYMMGSSMVYFFYPLRSSLQAVANDAADIPCRCSLRRVSPSPCMS